jgi:hypothetical protein
MPADLAKPIAPSSFYLEVADVVKDEQSIFKSIRLRFRAGNRRSGQQKAEKRFGR